MYIHVVVTTCDITVEEQHFIEIVNKLVSKDTNKLSACRIVFY